ncbi:MAG: hypothetical protein A3J30_03480 [Candidatus Wildermuthbacteria bacterium RIFCSPLOWO2_02_FULL_47_9c]|uniref:DNA polymerase IV n=2 Tax=Parcubacteria group TaxID=1794811 RepID=A0A1G2RZD4_9BACT|nr:MAG: hypothetical protein A2109_02215 [Candidatus Wildermuthbacteria bacterium GWA1_49_26]OHA66034.1 MAG: hypothetical protein A2674_00315 [Candidatus Wildermuthbacteria bacterium RIFCSPHIGHO2_01_FULL_50_47]OHA69956.1 MAG: hypothetical protein A3D63_01870 [Candidatus Wildermuthbacteria bacterium RIFCSPHIGHO2_02_FULL_49_17]OHA72491.1 MAG: hypothetical protein A3E08_02230 [Candidatus Wildermuthbacteria bacterium RIFCSPHIGHO2_12_FULL_49_13]OHA75145.1 MAG: hypothetical protein A3B28_01350 [Candi
MKERIILHVDMDAFFAAIEERENPQFRGKPLVVGADPKGGKGRGVVSTANYEARKFGIHSALPISQAFKLCPSAIFLPVNGELYKNVSANIMKIIGEFSPLIEQASLDEAYIDVSFAKTYERAAEIAEEMRKKIWEQEKLTCSCGVGPNKMIAKIACEAVKPDGVKVVKAQDAERFMEFLDVQKIPGIGVKTAQILRSSGLERVADLKKLSAHDMEDLFGARAQAMTKRVRGIDEEPLAPEREIKSIGRETTFEQDTRDPEVLVRTLEQLAKQASQEVQEKGFYVKTVGVVCRLRGFATYTRSKTLSKPTQEEAVLRAEAMKLFLRFVLEEKKPLRLVGVRFKIASA